MDKILKILMRVAIFILIACILTSNFTSIEKGDYIILLPTAILAIVPGFAFGNKKYYENFKNIRTFIMFTNFTLMVLVVVSGYLNQSFMGEHFLIFEIALGIIALVATFDIIKLEKDKKKLIAN